MDCEHPKVYLQKDGEKVAMINTKSGKSIKELNLIELLKEVEYGKTTFGSEIKLILRGKITVSRNR